MKKNTAEKSTFKSWLIALIVFVVVAVIAVGVSFIPNSKNCNEVAAAAVTELYDHAVYMFDTPVSTTLSPSSGAFTTTTNLAGYVFSQNHSHVFDKLVFNRYIPTNQSSFQYRMSFYYENSLVFYLRYYAYWGSSPYTMTIQEATWSDGYGSETLTDNYFGFQYYYNGTLTSGTWWNAFKQIITLYPTGPTVSFPGELPIIDTFTSTTGIAIYDFKVFEITNASAYTNGSDDVVIDLKLNSTVYENITISPINGRYYFCLCTRNAESWETDISIRFHGDDTYYDFTYTGITTADDNGNYLNTVYSGGFNMGYSGGYYTGYTDGEQTPNNLVNLAWNVFEMPFTLMFGHYDSDPNSATFGQWIGGLFNFTILGLDVRSLVLAIISVCLLIAIIKVILGTRGD